MNPERPLRLLCWEGYDQPQVTAPFTARTQVAIEAGTHISDATTAGMLRVGQSKWDVLNINNAYVKKDLWPRGCIEALPLSRFELAFDRLLPQFQRLYHWARAPGSGELVGICQRFGAFNLVINTRLVSRARAEDEGFALAEDPSIPFGVLAYDDFNLFHICIAAGVNPFEALNQSQFDAFGRAAAHWFARAHLVSDDHHRLNRALIEGEVACYLSGGVYTASPVRLAGHSEIVAITPATGPIEGRGGIVFTEVTSLLRRPDLHPGAQQFIAYLLEPETAVRVALSPGTCNPVAQVGDPRVMRAFSREQLNAIQWDTLEEDISRCADYDLIPDHDRLLVALQAAKANRHNMDA